MAPLPEVLGLGLAEPMKRSAEACQKPLPFLDVLLRARDEHNRPRNGTAAPGKRPRDALTAHVAAGGVARIITT
eukprot:71264-Lingulodinium_polyedra.AAC.1